MGPDNIRTHIVPFGKIVSGWDSAAYAIVNEATKLYDQGTVECTCEHSTLMHDVAETSGEGSVCCVDGCGCGTGG